MRSRLAPWLVFLVTLLCAAAVAWYVDATSDMRERLRYETSAATVALEVGSRLDTYLALLRATQAFMASSDTVTAEEFTDYVGRLRLRERFPGLQGLGYSLRLRGEVERHAIVYLEPQDARNRAALGFDMSSEPVRRAAMARARDAARSTASGRVRLVQEITPEKQQGFLVYLPVYAGGRVPETVEERRRRLAGFVYSPFRVGDLLAYAVEPGLLDEVSFRVYDGAAPSADGLLYDSHPNEDAPGPALQRRLEVAGRAWTLVFRPRRAGGPLEPSDAPLVLLAGVLVGAMLAGTTHSLVRARERAERAAAELRASEAALRLTEERFRSLVEQSPFSIQIVEPGGRTIAVNHSWERLWGGTLDQLGDHSILADAQLEAQGTLPLVREAFAGATRALPVVRYVPDRGERAGRPVWVRTTIYPLKDGQGRVREVVVVHEDITEQRRAQDALAKERELLAIILDNTESGIVACDAEGRLTRFNRKTRELVGRGEAPILPEQWAAHYGLHSADGTRMLRLDEMPLVRALRGERVRDVEMTIVPDGAPPRSVLANAEPMHASDGSLVGAVCVMFDITERKRADEAIRRAQKLESVGVLAGGIAHDFNNLLTGILGNASLALRSLGPDSRESAEPLLEDVIRAGERAAILTQQLLAYAGKGRFFIQPVDLGALTAELVRLVHSSVPRKVAIELKVEPGLPAVEADAGQLQQLVMNLAINAAEAIGNESGRVTIGLRRRALGPGDVAAEHDFDLAPGAYVELTVADTGCGMDAATVAQIFDPFFTTKFTGRGLGLAAALGIVRGHRGAIQVDSAPGRGTTFTVLLPASSATTEPGAADAVGAGDRRETAPEGRGAVLVVDDEQMVRDLARVVLEEDGWRVLEAGDGREALEVLEAHAAEVRAVLLDLTMPVMGGEEALPALQARKPGLPVVLTSGYGEQSALERIPGAPPAFLQKPFTADALLAALRDAVAGGPA